MLAGSGYPAQAFTASGYDPEFLTLFAERCLRALGYNPALAADCPPADRIASAAQKVADPTAAALERLARLLARTQS